MIAFALTFVIFLVSSGECAEKVQLGFYSESLCPDCIAFANGPLEKAMEEASTPPREYAYAYVRTYVHVYVRACGGGNF